MLQVLVAESKSFCLAPCFTGGLRRHLSHPIVIPAKAGIHFFRHPERSRTGLFFLSYLRRQVSSFDQPRHLWSGQFTTIANLAPSFTGGHYHAIQNTQYDIRKCHFDRSGEIYFLFSQGGVFTPPVLLKIQNYLNSPPAFFLPNHSSIS